MKRLVFVMITFIGISFIYTKPIDKPKQPVELKDRTHKQQLRYFKYQTRDKGYIK